MSSIKIVLADDHEIFREALKCLLTKQKNFVVVAEASTGEELVHLVKVNQPNIVLTDIRMPVMDGITATKIITRNYPATRVIGLSLYEDAQLVKEMRNAGACDYVLKTALSKDLFYSIQINSTSKIANMISVKFINSLLKKRFASFHQEKQLTGKQVEIMKLLCQEYTSKEIAARLSLSTRTVEQHRRHIYKITDAKNVVGIILYAIKHRIIDINEQTFNEPAPGLR
jgi:two-component system response regulator NreC